MSAREQLIKAAAVNALKLWREARDSGWDKHAHTEELLDAVNIMSHAYDIEHDELTAAQARVAELEQLCNSVLNWNDDTENPMDAALVDSLRKALGE